MKITISDRMADELRDWAQEQRDQWPSDTAFQSDLADLLRQLDAPLLTAADMRGTLPD